MKLYVFEHCPFCIKAMMLVGLKQLPVEIVFLQNHDVEARIAMVGRNTVPILAKDDGTFMAESMDIVSYLDNYDKKPVLSQSINLANIQTWEQTAYSSILPLLFPRTLMIDLPEFASEPARQWFRDNKTAMLGRSFEAAYADSDEYLVTLNHQLSLLDWLVLPSERANTLSYDDVHFYPTLRNLTLIKGIRLPVKVRHYIDEVTQLTGIQLFDEVAV
ncbi:glutaredoxin 2 [Thalassotalea euphylliae]|uniref:Glutaredoxin 2 n=2 Tax=Thalassotalea euphylliae TaxID=1655234 RepID=A0A3E0TQI3_9GAMM|nr:glutaredoxin 2 [Thalassotalea euphylliae]